MYGGHSGCYGFIMYNRTKDGSNGVYGYYEGDEIKFEYGSLNELLSFKKVQEQDDKKDSGSFWKKTGLIFLVMLLALVAVFNIFPLRIFFAALIFSVISLFPLIVLLVATQDTYRPNEKADQFKRFHGCEHAVLKMNSKKDKIDATVENLKTMSIYDSECGTVYSGYVIFLALVLAVLIVNPLGFGFFKAVGVFVLTIILLFINIFNPYNPFKLLQRPVVTQPTDYEYLLGLAVLRELWKMEG